MKSKEEIELTAYGLWLTAAESLEPSMVMISSAMLSVVLWILDTPYLGETHLDEGVALARKALKQNNITNPLDVICKDVAARKESREKALNAINN